MCVHRWLRDGFSAASSEECGGIQKWRPLLHREEVRGQPETGDNHGGLSQWSDPKYRGSTCHQDPVHPQTGSQGPWPPAPPDRSSVCCCWLWKIQKNGVSKCRPVLVPKRVLGWRRNTLFLCAVTWTWGLKDTPQLVKKHRYAFPFTLVWY